jgi:hypothetical protein
LEVKELVIKLIKTNQELTNLEQTNQELTNLELINQELINQKKKSQELTYLRLIELMIGLQEISILETQDKYQDLDKVEQ